MCKLGRQSPVPMLIVCIASAACCYCRSLLLLLLLLLLLPPCTSCRAWPGFTLRLTSPHAPTSSPRPTHHTTHGHHTHGHPPLHSNAEKAKTPVICVVGNKEAESNSLAVRLYGGKELGALPVQVSVRCVRALLLGGGGGEPKGPGKIGKGAPDGLCSVMPRQCVQCGRLRRGIGWRQ